MSFELGFFEYLNVADSERIHSQMIAWLLSKDSPLGSERKSTFLNKFLGLGQKAADYKSIDAITEALSVDILIRADDDIYIIENKLKSSEHSEQLARYLEKVEEAITSNAVFFKDGKFRGAYFLTLIGEKATDEEWKNITYKELLDAMRTIEPLPEGSDQIISAYIKTLTNLDLARDAFEKDHKKFKNVFTDGGKKKTEKRFSELEPSPEAQYIANCQLETIFQKLFFRKIADDLSWKLENGGVGETRGSALCQVDFCKSEVPVLVLDDREYKFGFQVQGSSVKLNFQIVDDYKKSQKKWIEGVVGVFRDFVKEKNKSSANLKLRVNAPRSLAYVSLSYKSYKLCPCEYEFDELCKKYERCRQDILSLAKELASKIQQVNS